MMEPLKCLLDYRSSLDEPNKGDNKILFNELKWAFKDIVTRNPGRNLGVQIIVTDYGEKT